MAYVRSPIQRACAAKGAAVGDTAHSRRGPTSRDGSQGTDAVLGRAEALGAMKVRSREIGPAKTRDGLQTRSARQVYAGWTYLSHVFPVDFRAIACVRGSRRARTAGRLRDVVRAQGTRGWRAWAVGVAAVRAGVGVDADGAREAFWGARAGRVAGAGSGYNFLSEKRVPVPTILSEALSSMTMT